MISAIAVFFASLLLASQTNAAIDFGDLSGGCNDTAGYDCGGNGKCVANVCHCDPYWSSLTDFVELSECATSEIGIYVLWAINVVVVLWSYYQSSAMIMLRFEMFFEQRKARKGYRLCDNKGLVALIFYFGISAPFHLIMAITHFVDPTTRVAFDILPTICFFFGKFGFYASIFFVQSSMFGHVMKGMKGMSRLVPLNTAFQMFVALLSIVNGGIAFVTLINFQNDVQRQVQIMQAYYSIQTITLFINSSGAFLLTMLVNKMFGAVKDISSGRSEDVRKKVNELQLSAMKQAGVQSIVYLFMASIPFFINKHGYFLPISWIAMPLLGKKLALQFMSDRAAKPIMERLGIKRTGGSSSAQEKTGGSQGKAHTGSNRTNVVQNPTEQLGTTTALASSSFQQEPQTFTINSPMRPNTQMKVKVPGTNTSSAMSEGAYLDELMDPAHPLHKRFMKFIDDRYASNEIALFSSTLDYRNAIDTKERTKIGKYIVKEFIEIGASRGVDLPSSTRDILLSTAKRSQWVATSLDEVRRTLVFELKGNFLLKFEEMIEKANGSTPGTEKL